MEIKIYRQEYLLCILFVYFIHGLLCSKYDILNATHRRKLLYILFVGLNSSISPLIRMRIFL